jgi:hypothetical protein
VAAFDLALVETLMAKLTADPELLQRFRDRPADVVSEIVGRTVDAETVDAIKARFAAAADGVELDDEDLSKVSGGFTRTQIASLNPSSGPTITSVGTVMTTT